MPIPSLYNNTCLLRVNSVCVCVCIWRGYRPHAVHPAEPDERDEKLKHGVPGAGRDGVENEKQRGM